MGALAIAAKSPQADQHWKAVEIGPGLVSGNVARSELTESKEQGLWGLHPSLSINSQAGASPDRLSPTKLHGPCAQPVS